MIAITAQYAIRALTELAALPPGVSAPGRDLARLAGIPQNYLSKILRTLGRHPCSFSRACTCSHCRTPPGGAAGHRHGGASRRS
jgi:hypothetical protein